MSSGTLYRDVAGLSVVASLCALAVAHFTPLTRADLDAPGQGDAVLAEAAVPASEPRTGGRTVELRAADSGHYHVEAEINGRPVEVMVDTGATLVALSYEDAERAGLYLRPSDFIHSVSTANGTARVAVVTLDRVAIGDISVRNVKGVVAERGRLETSLLGMSFLGRLERVDMRAGTLLLSD